MDWIIEKNEFLPDKIEHEQTIFTIGNGYLCTRGSLEEGFHGKHGATFMHGVFDEAPTVFVELVNLPDWTAFSIVLDNERFDLAKGEILSYKRQLDLQTGLLHRQICWKSPEGKTTDIRFERFISLDDSHLMLVRINIIPIDYDGEILVYASLNGEIANEIPNNPVGYKHWDWVGQELTNSSGCLHLRTRNSKINLAMAFCLSVEGDTDFQQTSWNIDNHPALIAKGQLNRGKGVTFEKRCIVYSSRDVSQPVQSASDHLERLNTVTWAKLFKDNQRAWQNEWDICDIIIDSDDDAQLIIHFNLFHLLIAAPRNDERVSIGAKTLSGYGYFGHVFWDTEIYLLPFFTYTRPEIAKNLLSYRWHRLPAARQNARKGGFLGAQFPWESAVTGREVTPIWGVDRKNPKDLIRIWTGDKQIHISSDIAYTVWQYWRITGDDEFMIKRGARIIIETAQFWVSRLEWNNIRRQYEITNVMGPDEYHEYTDNNAYTNYIVKWHLQVAVEVFKWIEKSAPEQFNRLLKDLKSTKKIFQEWQQIAEKIFIPLDKSTGMIEQFEGFFKLEELDMGSYEPRNQSIPEIIGIEETNKVQILKQPDVVMLFNLFNQEFSDKVVEVNYEYYSSRTDHSYGSSLGPAYHAIVACKLDHLQEAYEQFKQTAYMDLYDTRGNAGDGIHAASAGGTWQVIVFGFAGLSVNNEGWEINPKLPDNWKRLSFKFFHKGKLQEVNINK